MNTQHPDHPEEIAFRRGVAHALSALHSFCERQNSLGTEACLAEALNQAREMRADRKAIPWYTHELMRRVQAVVNDHDKHYFGEPDLGEIQPGG